MSQVQILSPRPVKSASFLSNGCTAGRGWDAPRAIGGSRSGTVAARRDIVCRRIASAAKVTGRAVTADGTLAGARDVACGAATAGDGGARADGRRASRLAGAVDAARVQACARAT